MIARTWHGVTPASEADEYLEYLRRTGVAEYQRVPGNCGVYVLRRIEQDHAHFLLLTFWDSLVAIQQFAGADIDKAKYYPEDTQYLLELEPTVTHYEVLETPRSISQATKLRKGAISMIQSKSFDLFAGIPVANYTTALAWYEQLLGSPPTFIPNEIEAVWELAEHRYLYIEQRPGHAGHVKHTLFVDNLDTIIAQIADRGLEPAMKETYENGVRKITYRDPDGNEIGFGGTAQ